MWITLEKCVTVAVTKAVVIAEDYVITPPPLQLTLLQGHSWDSAEGRD